MLARSVRGSPAPATTGADSPVGPPPVKRRKTLGVRIAVQSNTRANAVEPTPTNLTTGTHPGSPHVVVVHSGPTVLVVAVGAPGIAVNMVCVRAANVFTAALA